MNRGYEPVLAGYRVLIVEDEAMIAMDMAQLLGAMGAEVIGPVASVEDALALIVDAAIRIDRAVLDINLRGQQGFAVADALLARGVPFVFATGYDTNAVPARHAAVPLIDKPIDPALLAAALAR